MLQAMRPLLPLVDEHSINFYSVRINASGSVTRDTPSKPFFKIRPQSDGIAADNDNNEVGSLLFNVFKC
jgi:hypothetical protein